MSPARREFQLRGCLLVVKQGDITREATDAIVNAANERMLGGGGVDGAIHRAAGGELVQACAKVPEVSRGVRCPTGEARITPGFKLAAKFVIHTVGPIYEGDRVSAPLLSSAYRSSLKLAIENKLASVSFPALSCGVFGYPWDKAAHISMEALDEVLAEAGEECTLKEVNFVLFGSELYDVFVKAAEEIVRKQPAPKEEPAAKEEATAAGSGDGAAEGQAKQEL